MKLILPTEFSPDLNPKLPPDVEVVWADTHSTFEGDPSDAEVYLNWFYLKPETLHKVLEAAPQLRWMQTPSAGVNHILTPQFLERNITLTNGAGTFAVPIAEFVMAFILNYAKCLPKLHELQAQRQWLRSVDLPFQEVDGATLLIIGAGSIGQTIAQRANAFGMQVWGSRRHPQPMAGFEKVVGTAEWRSLLPEADYVVLATPLTPETKGLFDEAALRLMRPSSYFINIARGAVVDEPALIRALSEGWIAGAGLDTFATEPLPPESLLWGLPNVFITPHCSGMSPKIVDRTIALFLDNLQRYRTGQPLRNVVNVGLGY
ncbi:D-2-hydroxyacid dehydrogenase [filamentous cyanobacterium CCP2]|nr:D-2-hydroxyacid dehydrogenase [filamentous cyanobacterium CCP2]